MPGEQPGRGIYPVKFGGDINGDYICGMKKQLLACMILSVCAVGFGYVPEKTVIVEDRDVGYIGEQLNELVVMPIDYSYMLEVPGMEVVVGDPVEAIVYNSMPIAILASTDKETDAGKRYNTVRSENGDSGYKIYKKHTILLKPPLELRC